MKKKLLIFPLVAICIILLVSCNKNNDKPQSEDLSNVARIVILDENEKEYILNINAQNTSTGLLSALDSLQIHYVYSYGDFKELASLKSSMKVEEMSFIQLFTNEEIDQDKTEYAESLFYKRQLLVNTNKHATDLVIKNQTIIYIKLNQ